MEARWCCLMVAIATICAAGESEVQSLSPQEMEADVALEASLKMCQGATSYALNLIKAGKVQSLSAVNVFRKAEAAVEAKDKSEDENDVVKPTQTEKEIEMKADAQDAQEAKDNAAVKAEEAKAESAQKVELMGTDFSNDPNRKANQEKAERAEEAMEEEVSSLEAASKATALRKQLQPGELIELGESESAPFVLPGSPLDKCQKAAVVAIKEAIRQQAAEQASQTPAQKAINAVVGAEKAQNSGTPLEQATVAVARATDAVAKAKSPLEKTVTGAELVEAQRTLSRIQAEAEKAKEAGAEVKAEENSVAKAKKVAMATGTVAKAEAAEEAEKEAKKVVRAAENGIVAKAEDESAAVKAAKQAAKASPDMIVKADIVVEKEVKKVENGTPQAAEVIAVESEQASKAVVEAVLHSDKSAKVQELEKEAVVAAQKVNQATTSAATTVAEVKADNAAKTAEKEPSAQNEVKMVAAVEAIQNPKQGTPEVQAVKVARELTSKEKADREKAKAATTAEEKKMVASAGGVLLAQVIKAGQQKSDEPTMETKPTPTSTEIRAQIEGKRDLKEEAKKNRIDPEVEKLAETSGPIGKMLKAIIQAKGTPPSEGLSNSEKEQQAETMRNEAADMFQKQPMKFADDQQEQPAEDQQPLEKMEESIKKEEIPKGGFKEDTKDEQEKKEAKNLAKIEEEDDGKTSKGEKVGEGILLEDPSKK